MDTAPNKTFDILLVDPAGDADGHVATAVRAESGMDLLGVARSVSMARQLLSRTIPDLVLIAPALARGQDYARLVEDLRTRGIRRAILPGTTTGLTLSGFRPGVPERQATGQTGWKTVVLGTSTGGIEALLTVLAAWPAEGPPALIVQHINPAFVEGVAARLDRHCGARVRPAMPEAPVLPGEIYIAPGDSQHLVLGPGGRTCRLVDGPRISGHRPSVDALFDSAAGLGPQAVGVILTGMGQDGARGLAAIRAAGGHTIGQDRQSSVVYGMPRAAMAAGAVAEELPLARIGPAALRAAALRPERATDA